MPVQPGYMSPQRPILLARTSFTQQYLELLGIDEGCVVWCNTTATRYRVTALDVLDYRVMSDQTTQRSDRLSTAPAALLQATRSVFPLFPSPKASVYDALCVLIVRFRVCQVVVWFFIP